MFPGRERKKSEPLHGNAPKKESLSAQITAMEKFLFRGKPGGWVAAGLWLACVTKLVRQAGDGLILGQKMA